MLLSPIFGFDTLNFTKGKFTRHELGVYCKKHSRTKSLLSRKITLNNYFCLLEIFEDYILTQHLQATAYEAKEICITIL